MGSIYDDKNLVAIVGNIAAGKTTLANHVKNRFGFDIGEESVSDNPYLEEFYSDINNEIRPSESAYKLQIYFLLSRYSVHDIGQKTRNSTVLDRSIYEDANIFAKNLNESEILSSDNYEKYLNIYGVVSEILSPPDLLVYLKTSVPELKNRVAKRGRDYESELAEGNNEYLEQLNKLYENWIDNYDLGRKLIIETDDLDLAGNSTDIDFVLNKIRKSLEE